MRGIVRKTFGLADVLRNALDAYSSKIKAAFIYGSVAKGTDSSSSDIDIMIISDELTYPDVLVTLSTIEAQIGRPLNPTIYTTEEFGNKVSAENSFIVRVIGQQKIFLIGSKDDIPTI